MNNIEEFCLVKLLAHKQSPTEWNWFAVCKISAIVRLSVPLFVCNVHIEGEQKTKCSTNGNKWLWCEIAFQLRPCVFMERKFKIYLKQLFIVHNNQAIFGFVNEFCFSLRKANEKQSVCDCWIETINWIWGLFSPSTVYHTMTQPVDMPIPKHTQTNSPFCLFSVDSICVRSIFSRIGIWIGVCQFW